MATNAEDNAMIHVLKTVRIPPFAIRNLLGNPSFKSFTSIYETMGGEPFDADMKSKSFDTFARVVTYMSSNGLSSFASVTPDALANMQVALAGTPVKDDAVDLFFTRLNVTGINISDRDAYVMNVTHGVWNYASLYRHLETLQTGGLPGVHHDTQILLWKILSTLTAPDDLDILDDPLADFHYKRYAHNEMNTFLEQLGFSDEDKTNVLQAIIDCEKLICDYETFVSFYWDFHYGAGKIGNIPESQRLEVCRAISFMESLMKEIPRVQRFARFDVAEFRNLLVVTESESECVVVDRYGRRPEWTRMKRRRC